MASPMADAYCPTPMGNAYCATPTSVVPTRPTAHHEQQMGLGDGDMTAVLAVVVVGALALRWRLLR